VATAEAATPTGLTPDLIGELSTAEKRLLAVWHAGKAGDNDGRLWLPGAVRRLDVEARLELATDHDLDAQWEERERRRVRRDVEYFTEAYGHLQDDEGGPPIPFALWPEQREVLDLIGEELRIAILKARQLGLTWLVLHFAYHHVAFDPDTANALVLVLSQDGGYAKRALERLRRIHQLLPAFLRQPEDRDTQESKSEFKLVGRGRVISLAGTKDAPRTHTASLGIADEWAFVRNGQAGPTMAALLSNARRIIAISSGNGPPDQPGKSGKPGIGQYFARLVTGALEGTNEWAGVFLPDSVHPDRTPEWREAKRGEFDTDEEFLQEHPEKPDDALIGTGLDRYFALGDIAAAVRAGAALDELLGTEEMPPPAGERTHLGIDWGEATAAYLIWPLEGGGVYVPPFEREGTLPATKTEPAAATDAIHAAALELQEVDRGTGRVEPPIGEARYDAAGIQSMRTFLARARARFTGQYADGEVRSRKVPFGKYKGETATYLRRLFRRTGQGRTTGIIAVSPGNPELIRQLRSLESGGGDPGKPWKKADDQHGPDAVLAGAQRIARRHRELGGGATDEDPDEEA
jgi:hypothetical protein